MLEEVAGLCDQNGAQRIKGKYGVLRPEILAGAGAVCQRLPRVKRCFSSDAEREIERERERERSAVLVAEKRASHH